VRKIKIFKGEMLYIITVIFTNVRRSKIPNKFQMRISNFTLILFALLAPAVCSANEVSRGTVIMISSVSGWILLTSAALLWKEIKRNRD